MDSERLFKIGEVAKMFNVSMGTLRHYEQAGLLVPEYIDEDTGYRYYSIRQFEVLNTIRYMRVLDMPLSQIADFLKNRDVDIIEEKLEHQKSIIMQKQKELDKIARKIDHRLEHLHDAMNSTMDVIEEIDTLPQKAVWIEEELEPKSYLDLEFAIRKLVENQSQPLVFMGKVGIGITKDKLLSEQYSEYGLVYMTLDDEDDYNGDVENLPAQHCVSVRFKGHHDAALKYYVKLREYIDSHGLAIAGASREFTLIDNGVTSDTDKFVTQITIPVE